MVIGAGKFKAQCLALIDRVDETRERIIITKRGKPMAMLIPAGIPRKKLFGFMKGTVKINGDIIRPVWPVWPNGEGA